MRLGNQLSMYKTLIRLTVFARENVKDGGIKQGRPVSRTGRQGSRVAMDRLVGVIANENEED